MISVVFNYFIRKKIYFLYYNNINYIEYNNKINFFL